MYETQLPEPESGMPPGNGAAARDLPPPLLSATLADRSARHHFMNRQKQAPRGLTARTLVILARYARPPTIGLFDRAGHWICG
jgi:hypothetical protein